MQVNGLSGITAIAGGYFHSMFLRNDGMVWACGLNGDGRLGDGSSIMRTLPVQSVEFCTALLTGIQPFEISNSKVEVFPNPSEGIVHLQMIPLEMLKNTDLEVFNMLGKKIYQSAISNPKTEIDLSGQPDGIYLLQIKSTENVSEPTR